MTCSALFKELKSRCNKEDLRNLHLTSNRLKLLRTKNQREEAIRRFIDVLSSSDNLMAQEEVNSFLKKNAFHIKWENELDDSKDDMTEDIDYE